MPFKIRLTHAQFETLVTWAQPGGGDILLDSGEMGVVLVGQGDERACILRDGELTEEP